MRLRVPLATAAQGGRNSAVNNPPPVGARRLHFGRQDRQARSWSSQPSMGRANVHHSHLPVDPWVDPFDDALGHVLRGRVGDDDRVSDFDRWPPLSTCDVSAAWGEVSKCPAAIGRRLTPAGNDSGQRRGSPGGPICVSGREFTTNSASSSSVCSTSSFGALVCSVALKATFMDLTRRSQLPPIWAWGMRSHRIARVVASSDIRSSISRRAGELRLRPRSLCRGRYIACRVDLVLP
ncbi:hypothetical protein EVAR_58248_1 [Eumeta japonica]|uniref:Uncharacterized protein n=1 Tax=Eumeta variegata TaxID=151549 RepID=A0A4C2AEW0_EUMVA|nr:hypothetical protein EVAR_58248_1 [Eumeta japonica]